ncbi:hypothetical protein [Halobaculum sp. MBLA0143]|uniref:hypothetical protein n=1 Tax=Halobaculum sp. MBLA0143 TaxID=3079933 RepID=UPI003525E45A
MTEPVAFARQSAFEHGTVAAADGGADGVVLAEPNGQVRYVDSEGQFTLRRPGTPVADVAAGRDVYVLADGTVTAYGTGGSRRWEATGLEPVGLVAGLTERGVVVETVDDELVWLRGDTGTERRRLATPHADAPGETTVVAGDGTVAVASFTSFTRIVDGEPREPVQLDGAVERVGLLDGRLFAVLADGSAVAYEDGRRQWSEDAGVDWLASNGTEWLLCETAGELAALRPDGDRTPVTGLSPDGTVVPSTDGSVVCVVAGGTAGVFRPSSDAGADLSVSVPAASVDETAATLPVAVGNDGDVPVDDTVQLTGEGVTFAGGPVPLSLGAGDSLTREFELRELSAGEVTVRLSDGDGTVDETSLTVRESTETASVTGEPVGVTDGRVTVAVEVSNATDTPVEGGYVADSQIDRVPAGDTVTVEAVLDPPVDGVTVTLDKFGERTVDVAVPEQPLSVDVASADETGYAEVTVESRVDCPTTDRLVVQGLPSADDRVTRELSLPPAGSLCWRLPSVDPERRIVEAATETANARLTLDPGVVPAVADTRGRRRPTGDVAAATTDPTATATGAAATTDDAASAPANDPASAATGDTLASGPPVTVERSVAKTDAWAGVAVTDRLQARSTDGADRTATLERPLDDDTTLPLEPRAVGTRRVVVYRDERLPPLSVAVDGDRVSTSAVDLTASDGPVVPYVWRTVGDDGPKLCVAADGDDGVTGRVEGVTLDSQPEPFEFECPFDGTVASQSLPSVDSKTAVPAQLNLVVDGERRRLDTLAPRLATDDGPSGLAVDSLTGGDNPSLTVVNTGDAPVEDVRLRCHGDGASVATFGDGVVDSVGPGETREFLLELTPETDADEVVVTVETVSVDDEAVLRRERAVGDGDGAFEVADAGDDRPEFPSILVGPFAPE